jgi:hypothetical protein
MRDELREKMKEETAAMKKQLLSIMNKQCKVHPKTLQRINNTLNNNCNNTNIINIVHSLKNLHIFLEKVGSNFSLEKLERSVG